jgi:glycosyltransferase involved in cell wall biosynthesis
MLSPFAESSVRERKHDAPIVSVVIPCLDEAETIAQCVRIAIETIVDNGLAGEVIVVDNGSTDGSGEVARAAGAVVVDEPRRGYGRAYLTGLARARGDYIFIADADLSYDFRELPRFLRALDEGAELVVGNRMNGIRPGAMPLASRIGNPLLTKFMRMIVGTSVGDVWCGMRAFRRDILPKLDLRSTGMDFAPEMVIRATRLRLKVRELPIQLHPRGGGISKLSPLRDGWRHLRLMLVYSPNVLFVLPGTLMLLAGIVISVLVLSPAPAFGRQLYLHSLIVGSLLVLLGVQAIGCGICARAYGVYFIGDHDELFSRLRARLRLEHGVALATLLVAVGLSLFGLVGARWAAQGFGGLSEQRLAIVAMTVTAVAAQVFFTSFLLSIIGLRWRGDASR